MGIARAGVGGVSGLQYQSTADIIEGSVKFNTTGYLEKTQSAGNQTTWTWSSWIKVGDLSGNNIFGMEGGYPNVSAFYQSDGKLRFTAAAADSSVFFNLVTEPQYRDFNGWYHVVLNYDSGNAEQKDRGRIYINGKRVVHLDTSTYPSLNATTEVNNNGNEFRIASHSGVDHLDGYTTTIHFIDGQALSPHFFGFTDPLTNTWKPKKFDVKGTTFNDGTTWSNFATAYATPGNAFDGNTGTAALYTVADEFVFTPPKPIRASTLRLYVNTGSGSPIDVSTNGKDFTGIFRLENGAQYSEIYEITDGLLTQLRVKTNAGGGGNIYQIWIDGELLVDNTTTNLSFGVNGFHLPMDGSAPVGQDQSGKGNDYRLYNFAGSAAVDKATGALPILNYAGATNASVGVRSDSNASSLVFAAPLFGNSQDVSNIINAGTTNKATTDNGSVRSSLVKSNFYGGSYLFDGSDDYISSPYSSDFDFGSGAFTVECWVNTTQSGNYPGLVNRWQNANTQCWDLRATTTDKGNRATFIYNDGSVKFLDSGRTVNDGKWHHIAAQRSGNTLSFYVDGVETVSESYSGTINQGSDTELRIGYNDTTYFNGYVNDVRIYKGVAKYNSTFTPASANPDVVLDSPSGVSGGGKLAKVTDGAVMFDGPTNGASIATGYLSIPAANTSDFNFGTGDFTWEGYFYGSDWTGGSSNDDQYVVNHEPTAGDDGSGLFVDGGQSYYYSNKASSRFIITGPILENERWYHIAAVRASGTLTMYVNGISVGSASYSDTYSDAIFTLGRNENNNKNQFRGFISNFRVLNSALYTSNFTPPAAPLTNVTNTKLLCCQSKTSSTAAAVTPGAIVANGDTPPSFFNPFNTDDNTVVGKAMGYATLNPLIGGATLSNGNLDYTTTAKTATSTIGVTSGKYYAEVNCNDGGGAWIGIINTPNERLDSVDTNTIAVIDGDGDSYDPSSTQSFTNYNGFSQADVIGVALDATNKTVDFYRNGIRVKGYTAFTVDGPYYFAIDRGASVTQVFSWNFGQKPFKFPPPEGFKPLCTGAARPESVVMRPDQYVGVTTYTGDGGASNSISGLNFGGKPDLVWVKGRSYSISHVLYDSVRGAGSTKSLVSNGTNTEGSAGDNSTYGYVSSFDNNGYSLVGGSDVNNGYVNKSGASYVGWCWRAGGSKGTFNVDDLGYATFAASGTPAGTITPTGTSIGTRQGFSIIKYTGTGSAATLPHGLSQAPEFLLVKNLDSTYNWAVYHKGLSSAAYYLFLNNGDAQSNSFYTFWDSTDPSSTVISLGADSSDSNVNTNKASQSHICYAWTSVPGLQKFGTYEGNNSTDGPFVELGFRPAIVWTKNIDSSASWVVYDNKRRRFNTNSKILAPNDAGGGNANDAFVGSYPIDMLSNGFKIRNNTGEINNSDSFIYCAWADTAAIDLFGGGANAT